MVYLWILQSYVQALQKKAQCGRSAGGSTSGAMGVGPECSTLQSDATHLTILPGGDHPQPDLLTDSEDDHTLHTH